MDMLESSLPHAEIIDSGKKQCLCLAILRITYGGERKDQEKTAHALLIGKCQGKGKGFAFSAWNREPGTCVYWVNPLRI